MIRRMALAFIGVLWASTAQAQVPCNQCQPQFVQCGQQAAAWQQACNAPYYVDYTNCYNYAYATAYSCWQTCTVYCHQCDWNFDAMMASCQWNYSMATQYCQTGYDAAVNMCVDDNNNCLSTCT